MQPKIVIVVDDDPSILRSITRLLGLHGYTVETFPSAEACFGSPVATTATCLLLDIHLGEMSGFDLYRKLAASGAVCPIIFMTALDDEATEREAAEMGCIAYLRKPFPASELLGALRTAAA